MSFFFLFGLSSSAMELFYVIIHTFHTFYHQAICAASRSSNNLLKFKLGKSLVSLLSESTLNVFIFS